MTPHEIRLRGFWELRTTPDGGDRLCRKFGRPRLTDPGETVWLICEACPESATLSLNGKEIGQMAPADRLAVEVTTTLTQRNELCVRFSPRTCESPLPTEPGQVRLEIYPAGGAPG